MASLYDCLLTRPDGEDIRLSAFEGKVLLIVNVASQCGFTSQYAGLEKLHRTYGPQGFSVLGFPCNQFGHQEPGTAEEIATFCTGSFGVTFPIFKKTDVNGAQAAPIFQALKTARKGMFGSEAIKWNFTKFLVDRHGEVTARHAPATKPEKLAEAIETLLKAA